MSNEKRKGKFSELPGGTTFHSFAFNGTLQPFVKTDRMYREPFSFNAIFIGNNAELSMQMVMGGSPVFLKEDADVEIDQFPWEV